MGRIARIVAPGLPHHVTQRGNRRQETFFTDGCQEPRPQTERHEIGIVSPDIRKQIASMWNRTMGIGSYGLVCIRPLLSS